MRRWGIMSTSEDDQHLGGGGDILTHVGAILSTL